MALFLATLALGAPLRVAVTGAGGQTGQHAFRKMLARADEFSPLGVVRTESSREALLESGVPPESVVVCDVTDTAAIAAAIEGVDALIIGTSAKPAPTGETDEATGRPIFHYPNGNPETVDWLGQKAQIDAAAACGPETHVVICSSMGGTDPSNMLNALGRVTKPDGSSEGGKYATAHRTGDLAAWRPSLGRCCMLLPPALSRSPVRSVVEQHSAVEAQGGEVSHRLEASVHDRPSGRAAE